eukprot:403373996
MEVFINAKQKTIDIPLSKVCKEYECLSFQLNVFQKTYVYNEDWINNILFGGLFVQIVVQEVFEILPALELSNKQHDTFALTKSQQFPDQFISIFINQREAVV